MAGESNDGPVLLLHFATVTKVSVTQGNIACCREVSSGLLTGETNGEIEKNHGQIEQICFAKEVLILQNATNESVPL